MVDAGQPVLGVAALLQADEVAAMGAAVEHRVDLAVLAAGDDDRRLAEEGGLVVAGLGQFVGERRGIASSARETRGRVRRGRFPGRRTPGTEPARYPVPAIRAPVVHRQPRGDTRRHCDIGIGYANRGVRQHMSEERVERRLAAILAADVAGYSPADGRGRGRHARARCKALRRELIDPKIAEHRGRIVKTTGDGLLVEFASVVDAVRCAVEVQRGDGRAQRRRRRPSSRIEFRIGINLGDIIVEDDDIFGDGVNIAARLEALAEPGGICVSARGARPGARQARPRLRGSGRAAGQEHRPAGARLSVSRLGASVPRGAAGREPRCRCPTSRRSRCCRSRT